VFLSQLTAALSISKSDKWTRLHNVALDHCFGADDAGLAAKTPLVFGWMT